MTTMTTAEAVRLAAKQLQSETGKTFQFIRDVALRSEQVADRELDIHQIHEALRQDQAAELCVLYPCDDPWRLERARHVGFTMKVCGEDRHLVHYR